MNHTGPFADRTADNVYVQASTVVKLASVDAHLTYHAQGDGFGCSQSNQISECWACGALVGIVVLVVLLRLLILPWQRWGGQLALVNVINMPTLQTMNTRQQSFMV